MDMTTVLVSAIVGFVTSIITAYVTSRLSIRQERIKWQREFAIKLAEAKSQDANLAKSLASEFSVGFLVVEVDGIRQKVPIPFSGDVRVGRHRLNDLVLNDPAISREHALFRAKDSSVYLFDRGTMTGVYVNSKRVEDSVKLKSGDIIEIGNTTLKFHSLEP